ncbi:glycosyltransferase family 39 protein [Granulicella sp. WH15]|uniref:ArnT family glycosyltransferase n=1 Tax=Granulicella sp. WH15 TaxID=2602070 RepID=UPI002104DAC1|nr:glycosyltransferase family 39 protein [Granulicella sp. WH15]
MATPNRSRTRFSLLAAPAGSPLPLPFLYPLFFVAVYLAHWNLLQLPYYWDEAGYYIPAALDFFHTGSLIPTTTLTNAHPPLPSLLLAGWWRLCGGISVGATRTLVCMIAAFALVGVFRLARGLAGPIIAGVVTLLTAIYPVWFAQSTLAHADIFAAAFTLWALSFYLVQPTLVRPAPHRFAWTAVFFSLAALAKETAIVTPAALALWEIVQLFIAGPEELADRPGRPVYRRIHLFWIAALAAPVLPLALWYAYHFHRTGFVFGNPEFLRYNATANLGSARILLSLWHRVVHVTFHMNMYVPVVLTLALLATAKPINLIPRSLRRPAFPAILVIVLGNLVAFSILGGALLTRYLLPVFPLVLLLCVSVWTARMRAWAWLAGLTAATFLTALWVNPPYTFAPEDNLTYRDMVILHERAINLIEKRFPAATVLTAWPATSELTRPELGYAHKSFRVTPLENFTAEEIQKAAADPGSYDTMLIFSSKWTPPPGALNLSRGHEATDMRYFDFHRDVSPEEAAAMLHGDIVWQAQSKGEWVAVLRFPRSVEARLFVPFANK